MKLCIIIPVFNEEGNIKLLCDRLISSTQIPGTEKELLFVNDGSTDKSLEIIKSLSEKYKFVKYIDLSRNFGHQVAISAGIDFVDGDRVVFIDADLQDPPEIIPELCKKMDEGYNVVCARRTKRNGDGFLKKLTARLFYIFIRKITRTDIPLDSADFKIIDKKIITALRQMPEKEKFLRGQIAWAGFRQSYITYERDKRHSGKSGYSFSKLMNLAFNGITSFSNFPLKIATIAGFLTIASCLIYLAIVLYKSAFTAYNPSWKQFIFTGIFFMGGVQLISIGIIGEYISRLSANARNRPLYFINESNISEQN